MSFDDVVPTVMRLSTAADALAAIGAYLVTCEPDHAGDAQIHAALREVLDAAGLDLSGLGPEQKQMLLRGIRLLFRQSADLLAHPSRPPGWSYTDPVILEGYGRGSSILPKLFARSAPELAGVRSFLDVGVGVGWFAIEVARIWPHSTVVGIDPWEPALERARANVAQAGLDQRISLRNQDVLALDDAEMYDCAWLPTFFFREDVLPQVVARVVGAVRPGGHVIVGRYEPPPDPLARAVTRLRIVRDGGCDISIATATELLRAAGCASVRPLERTWMPPIGFVLGQKAAGPGG